MALETGTFIDDLVITNPVSASDLVRYGAGHLQLIKTTIKNSFAGASGAVLVAGLDSSVTANTITLTPTPALTEYTTRMLIIWHQAVSSTGAVTINISGLGAKAVVSVANAALVSGDLVAGRAYIGEYDGTSVQLVAVTKNYVDQLAFLAALPAQSLGLCISTGTVASFSKTLTGFALDQVKSTDVASAATIDVASGTAGITGNLIHVTGAVTITAITLASGADRTLVFDGILTLTHNATTLILPGGQNITTAAGDRAIVRGDGAGNVRVISYTRAAASPAHQAKGADVASATTTVLTTTTGDFVHITGTTTITAITINSGDERTVVFDGALTLTHNATTLILPGGANITTAVGDRAIFRGDGAGNTRCISYVKASGVAVIVALSTAVRSARTSNTILAAADGTTIIDITSGTFSQTFTAAATLGSGWYCWIRNGGTGEITLDPNGAETIDSLTTFIMYPGEVRLVQCDASGFNSAVVHPFYYTYTASGTFTQPPGYKATGSIAVGAGGGGGSGCRDAAGTARCGGSGGGGGVRTPPTIFVGLTAGTGYTITIGAGGTAGAAVTVNTTAGNNGAVGGSSSFGTLLVGYGGGGGAGGTLTTAGVGGGGGGTGGAGGTAGAGGLPSANSLFGSGSTAASRFNTGGGGAAYSTSGAGAAGCAEFGGGAGGGTDNAGNGTQGGSSIYGGAGGGGGGGITAANAATAGQDAGKNGSYAAAGGAAGGAATGANGTPGVAGVTGACGGGGGGGGAAAAGAGGTGAVGGAPGGGAGGGAGSLNGNNSGAGGVGGRGEVQVWGVV